MSLKLIYYAVVPGYHLVWYNKMEYSNSRDDAVVPGYHLVWYNGGRITPTALFAVVPGYHLVWYNREHQTPHNFRDYVGFPHFKINSSIVFSQ